MHAGAAQRRVGGAAYPAESRQEVHGPMPWRHAPAADNGRGIAHPQEAGEPPAADQGLTDA